MIATGMSQSMVAALSKLGGSFQSARPNSGEAPFPPPGKAQHFLHRVVVTDGPQITMRANNKDPNSAIPAVKLQFELEPVDDTDGLGRWLGTPLYIPVAGENAFTSPEAKEMWVRNTLGRLRQHLKVALGLDQPPTDPVASVSQLIATLEKGPLVILVNAEHRLDNNDVKAQKPNPRVWKTEWFLELLSTSAAS